MKRLLAILFSLAMVFSLVTVSVVAAEIPTVTVETAADAVDTGAVVSLKVSIKDNTGYTNYEWSIQYDKDRLELQSIEADSTVVANPNNKNTGYGSVATAMATSKTGDGDLFTLVFKVKDSAKSGLAFVKVVSDNFKNNGAEISATYVEGGVTVNGTTGGSTTGGGTTGGSTTGGGTTGGSTTGGSTTGGSTTGGSTTGGSTTGGSTTGGSTTGGSTTGGSTTGGSTTGGSTTGGSTTGGSTTGGSTTGGSTTGGSTTGGGTTGGGETTCNHKYDENVWVNDEKGHWHICSVCGEKVGEAAHTPGADATETTAQTCTVCGYVIKAALGHTHSFTIRNTSDKYLKSKATCASKAVYYYSCTCGNIGTKTFEVGEKAAHSGGKATCTSQAICEVCGEAYGELADHTYGTAWKSDAKGHWHVCTVCGAKADEAAHKPGAAATETKPQTCTICGYVIKAATGHTHKFTEKKTDSKYLKSAATCTAKAVYYYSCTCGEKGTATFESGALVAHNYETKWTSNADKHWHACSVCGDKKDEAAHNFEWKIDKEATVNEAGEKHEECTVCGYKNASVAIDKIAQTTPTIVDGKDATWNPDSNEGLVFRSTASISEFVEVLMDGKVVAPENYDVREGSIIVELKPEYLATLPAGAHTLTIRATSGDASTSLTVEEVAQSSNTAVVVIVIVAVLVVAGAAVAFVFIRKKKAN